jgi:ADP-heptose:LPS heptosyltransferase
VQQSYTAKDKKELLFFCLKNNKKYDRVFLNHLTGGKSLRWAASYLADKVINNSPFFKQGSTSWKRIEVVERVHDAVQNYHLVFDRLPSLSIAHFGLQNKRNSGINGRFLAVHLAAGNNATPYKNWPIEHWRSFLHSILEKYHDLSIVLLGHFSEKGLEKDLALKNDRLISMIGKTDLSTTHAIIRDAVLFIGPDGGLLHLAVSAAKETFTIWGGSSRTLYGYAQFESDKHFELSNSLACSPCNAWIGANQTKTKDPLSCPDFACVKKLEPKQVFSSFQHFFKG